VSQTGSLCIVGLGPGTSALLTGQARAALQGADVVIGYNGYFTWVTDLVRDKECIALPLTQEVARARLAVERALAGQAVSVISSGDAGVYGMASLVLEVLEQHQANALLPEVVVIPGVSAVNACAALLGAPIAHDFAVLSLSDLLTPWAVIEKRLAAAAEADFVMVLLNPKAPGGSGSLRGPVPSLASIVRLRPRWAWCGMPTVRTNRSCSRPCPSWCRPRSTC